MSKPLITIIVPVYKVEPYLRRCLNSIVNQTFTNLEIILVDDGSPDNCPQICDEYAAKDNRIIVIHKENGGLSDARNAGLDICKGDYISFVDSDDWISNTFIELLLNAATENNAEIAISSHITTNQIYDLKINDVKSPKYEIFNPISAVKKLWTDKKITFVTAWGKLIKSSLLKNIRFPKNVIHEDEYTTYKLLYKANRTVFLDIPLYCYLQRDGSIMSNAKASSIRALKANVERYFFFKEHQEAEVTKLCLSTLCWDLLYAYGQARQGEQIQGFTDSKEILDLFCKCQNDYRSVDFPITSKFLFKLFSSMPSLYVFYQKKSPIRIRKI